ncbi:helix-turn-helix domain-containing protein [Sphingomonas sp. PAMC 26605]|uniref:helix-turn-helix domain-containing protein n=1 Tax=Sphingomonas sp. PAMC 26605 TaxID=1112214 RepID=UPI0009D95C79
MGGGSSVANKPQHRTVRPRRHEGSHPVGGFLAFTRAGYDALGVREIAESAGTDATIVIRLFGSKAGLFATSAESASVSRMCSTAAGEPRRAIGQPPPRRRWADLPTRPRRTISYCWYIRQPA